MGGGGANSLDSPKTADNGEFESNNNLPKNSDKKENKTVFTEPEIRTYSQYFDDYNITQDTITENDLSGDGSLSSPYVVYNAIGFRWLFQKKSLVSKYIELGADIVLNEEQFDENGNCSGGDGIVYSHGSVYNSPSVSFNGNGHTIFGFFSKTSTGSCGLFPIVGTSGMGEEYSNVNFRNVYLEGKSQVHCLGYVAQRIENIKVLSGTLKGDNNVSSLVYASGYVKNCVNYAKIVGAAAHTAGLIGYGNFDMENCENYGTVEGGGHYVAGLSSYLPMNSTIKNCYNYGEIKGLTMYIGGLFALQTNLKSTQLINCENYGKVSGGKYVGGLVGALLENANICFINCANSGMILSDVNEHGEFLGDCLSSSRSAQLQFIRCKNEGKNIRQRIINYIDAKSLELSIKNCDFMFSGSISNCIISATSSTQGDKNIYIENLNIFCKEDTERFTLFYNLGNMKNIIQLKNIYIKNLSNDNIFSNPIFYSNKISQIICDGIVVEDAKYGKHYYGTDFSGFYIDWKTGKIGLKALSEKGFYQGEVTEELLQNKDFEKKTI